MLIIHMKVEKGKAGGSLNVDKNGLEIYLDT